MGTAARALSAAVLCAVVMAAASWPAAASASVQASPSTPAPYVADPVADPAPTPSPEPTPSPDPTPTPTPTPAPAPSPVTGAAVWDHLSASYAITASVNTAWTTITATESVTVRNDSSAPVSSLSFSVLARSWNEMSISQVTVNGAAVAASYPVKASLLVVLPSPLAVGASVKVVIRFTDKPSADIGDSLRARLSRAGGVLQASSWHPVLSSGHGLRYPGDSQASAASDYDVVLSVPSALRVAAPGSVSSSTSGTTHRTTLRIRIAGAREFAFAASPYFRSATVRTSAHTPSGAQVSVTAYGLPGTAYLAAARSAARGVTSMSARYGAYPYSRLVVAQSARPASGNEYSGIVFIGRGLLGASSVVVHEAAHQWFYGLVGNDQLATPWIDESFAQYAGQVANGEYIPNACSTRRIDLPVTTWSNRPADNTCAGYNQTIYARGAQMLREMRVKIGGTAFDAAMRSIVAGFRGRVITEEDVVAAFAAKAADPAGLRAWLYGRFLTR